MGNTQPVSGVRVPASYPVREPSPVDDARENDDDDDDADARDDADEAREREEKREANAAAAAAADDAVASDVESEDTSDTASSPRQYAEITSFDAAQVDVAFALVSLLALLPLRACVRSASSTLALALARCRFRARVASLFPITPGDRVDGVGEDARPTRARVVAIVLEGAHAVARLALVLRVVLEEAAAQVATIDGFSLDLNDGHAGRYTMAQHRWGALQTFAWSLTCAERIVSHVVVVVAVVAWRGSTTLARRRDVLVDRAEDLAFAAFVASLLLAGGHVVVVPTWAQLIGSPSAYVDEHTGRKVPLEPFGAWGFSAFVVGKALQASALALLLSARRAAKTVAAEVALEDAARKKAK